MRFINFTILLMLFMASFSAQAGKENQQVRVADPYVDMRTGPGRGYPIYHIAQRGAELELLSRRTDWVQVRLADGKEGWVDLRQMRRTLQEDGSNTEFNDGSMADYVDHRWEVGVMGGDFGRACSIAVTGKCIQRSYHCSELVPHFFSKITNITFY